MNLKRFLFLLILFVCISIPTYIHFRPISVDANPCSGGYNTYLYDIYIDEWKYLISNSQNSSVENLSVNTDSIDISWTKRDLFVSFIFVIDNTSFKFSIKGNKYWIDKFTWSEHEITKL